MSVHRILLPLGFGLAVAGSLAGLAWWAGPGSLPRKTYMVEPHTCGVFLKTWDDEGFLDFVPNPPRISCERAKAPFLNWDLKPTVACTVQNNDTFTFTGTMSAGNGKVLIRSTKEDDQDVHLELLCDLKGRCDFARLWNDHIHAGFACLRDSTWQKKDEGI